MGATMNDLIERIEAASGPDREIDREIMLSSGYRYEQRDIGCRYEDGSVALDWVYVEIKTDKWRSTHPLSFTSSIDAALTLVPEGFEWSLEYQAGHHVSSDGECMVAIAKLGDPCRDWESTSATPALALCAAALKSRAYLKETNNAD